MTPEARVLALHARMDARRRARERRKTAALGSAGTILTACLIYIVFSGSGTRFGSAAGPYAGAALLFENAGGYVLAAVLAFMAGAAVTVFLLHRREQAGKSEDGRKLKYPEQSSKFKDESQEPDSHT